MPVMLSAPGAETVIDGRRYLYFAGTGYLGLHGHEEVVQAACEATQRYGLGTGTSRAGYGDSPPTLEVEREAARFCGAESALFFPSGYVGNHLLVSAVGSAVAAIFVDENSHYCVFEASRLSGLPVFTFPHADPDGLSDALRRNLPPEQRPLVMTDGVFSALGTIAPVREYERVLGEYPGAVLTLDDCHGLGVLGQRGRGTWEHGGYRPDEVNVETVEDAHPRRFFTATLSKALGAYGGIIAGSNEFIEQVRRSSHYYDGASPPPIPAAAAAAQALRLVQDDPGMIQRLQQNAIRLKRGLRALGFDTDDTPAPIICLSLGDAATMQRIQKSLLDQGILVAYKAAYAGLSGPGALRIAVFATHTEAMIQRLIDTMSQLV